MRVHDDSGQEVSGHFEGKKGNEYLNHSFFVSLTVSLIFIFQSLRLIMEEIWLIFSLWSL